MPLPSGDGIAVNPEPHILKDVGFCFWVIEEHQERRFPFCA
jgi:hypothetical protein